jgi:hypothetical protein
MNWYIVASIVSSFLLGWSIGIWFGTSRGYSVALEEQRNMRNQQMWEEYFNSINYEEEDDEEESANSY